MDAEQDDAILRLGGLALGQVLEDLGVVGAESDLQRIGLSGPKTNAAPLNKEEIYRGDYDDELEEEATREENEAHEDELAADESQPAQKSAVPRIKRNTVRGEDDDFDEDEEMPDPEPTRVTAPTPAPEPEPEPVAAPPPMSPRQEARTLFPDFAAGTILDFTELFATRSLKRRKMGARTGPARADPDADAAAVPTSGKELVVNADAHGPAPGGAVEAFAKPFLQAVETRRELPRSLVCFDDDISTRTVHRPSELVNNVETDDWEKRIVCSGPSAPKYEEPSRSVVSRPRNAALNNGSWFSSIIWDPTSRFERFDRLIMDMNDPEMILENEKTLGEKTSSLLRADAPPMIKTSKYAQELDKFNLSNDRMYEMSKEHRHRVRQTLGQLVIRHAWPAVKLQLPFYKTRLSKHETRSWHRPAIQFPSGMTITFSRVRSSKRTKDGEKRSKDPAEVLRSTRDLTLKDSGGFVLCEYSEEFPPLLSNLGMGSLLVNYYRKKDAKDDHIPRADLGEAFVLDITDESPFMKFGSVEPGQTQTVLYNNLTRAPLFRHKPEQNDFLFVRSTTKNEVRYYLRDIKNLFLAGQTYPVQPIPGPHARLVTNNIKYRLQMIAYKLVEKSHARRIKIHRVMKYFPDQNELQMRQRLKEFMAYNRKSGDVHQGFWRLKPNVPIPDESELQKLLTPEHICLVEGMQVGQRHLLDAGFTKTAEGVEDDGDETKMDIEQLLAPWITSKNFLHATQGKAMLKLHGEGDPSGRGEAFSFVRVSMKEIFLRAGEDVDERLAAEAEARARSGHRYNVAEQQAIYRSEIDRIWRAQIAALSNPEPPKVTVREEREWREEMQRQAAQHDERASKPLLVRRYVDGVWYKQIVRDPSVINAYVKQRQHIEEESIVTESLVPTGDAALDAQRRKRLEEEIAARVKNQDRRLQRKNAKAAAEGLIGGYKKMPNKTNTKRRCGRCGMVGHMATNNACPQYPSNNPGGRPGAPGIGVRPPSVMPMPNSTYYTNAANQQAGMSAFAPYDPLAGMGPGTPQ